jgi:Trk K+ transport system NAD-binding subunit
VSFIIRDGRLVTATGDTALQAGDEVLILAEPPTVAHITAIFTNPAPPPSNTVDR